MRENGIDSSVSVEPESPATPKQITPRAPSQHSVSGLTPRTIHTNLGTEADDSLADRVTSEKTEAQYSVTPEVSETEARMIAFAEELADAVGYNPSETQ